jgi:uncharacterized protein (TIGR03067 family)
MFPAHLSLAADPPAKGPKELQGTWKLISVEIEGEAKEPIGGQVLWTISGEDVSYGDRKLATLTVDAGSSPQLIDLKFTDPEGVVYEGIYRVEKGILKICINGQGDGAKNRPTSFATVDKPNWRLLTFEQRKDDANASSGLAGYVGLVLKYDDETKQVIGSPLKGAPADLAGVKADDVILKAAGAAVTDLPGLVNLVRKARPGEKLELVVRRGDEEKTVTIKVGVLPFRYVANLE